MEDAWQFVHEDHQDQWTNERLNRKLLKLIFNYLSNSNLIT